MEGKKIKIHVFKEQVDVTYIEKTEYQKNGKTVESFGIPEHYVSVRPSDYIADSKDNNYIEKMEVKKFNLDPKGFVIVTISNLERKGFNLSVDPIILDFNVPPYYGPLKLFLGKKYLSPEGHVASLLDKEEQKKFRTTFDDVVKIRM